MRARANTTRRLRRGFTLVEMLTVVAVIALLITILVPAVNAVRDKARETATRSLIENTLPTAISTFRADGRVGGRLPPSASDRPGAPPANYNLVANPYENLLSGDNGNDLEISGAGLLTWALVGADLLGTPGFTAVRSTSQYWAEDTSFGSQADPGAYYVDNQTGLPKFARAATYVDLSKVKVTSFNRATQQFDVPAEVEARQRANKPLSSNAGRKYPMFLDGYGFPILYWRADPAGVRMADWYPYESTDPKLRGVYHFADNADLLGYNKSGVDATARTLMLRPTREQKIHKLEYKDYLPPYDPQDHEEYEGFWHYIRNEDVQAKLAPHNADAYLLLSPGRDGLYGTADDIANFSHNGAHVEQDAQ